MYNYAIAFEDGTPHALIQSQEPIERLAPIMVEQGKYMVVSKIPYVSLDAPEVSWIIVLQDMNEWIAEQEECRKNMQMDQW
jgi:hypothetical protein